MRTVADHCRLAWRFARTTPSSLVIRMLVSSLLVFTGVTLLFACIAVMGTFQHTQAVAQARSAEFVTSIGSARAEARSDIIRLDGQAIGVLKVAPLPGRPPVHLPGLDRLPPEGTYVVSPALAREIEARPGWGNLFPVSGALSPSGAASGDELFAVKTVDRDRLQGRGVNLVSGFGNGPRPAIIVNTTDVPLWPRAAGVFVLAGLPATLLLVTGAGLASAVRAHRLSVMQRIGARRAGRRIAAVETVLLMGPGMLAAVVVWWAVLGRIDTVPVVGSRLLPDAWQLTPAFVVVLAYAVAVLSVATYALARPTKGVPQMGSGDAVSAMRSSVLVLGVFVILAAPWVSFTIRPDVFLAGFAISAVGVGLALPRWVRAWGGILRQAASVPVFLVGARLHRFPTRVARGWAPLAVACAIIVPVLVAMNSLLNVDPQDRTSEPPLHALAVQLEEGEEALQSLRHDMPDHVVGRYRYEDGDLVLSGTCEQAARRLGSHGCAGLKRQLRETLTWSQTLRFDPTWDDDKGEMLVLGNTGDDTLASLGAAAGDLNVLEVRSLTVPPHQQSPLVPWLVLGIGVGIATVLVAILILVVDRSMTARRTSTLGRIGLSLGRRRHVDALAFMVVCGITTVLGMGLGLLAAVVKARSDVEQVFPWQGLVIAFAAMVAIAVLGGAAVALGSTTAARASLPRDTNKT